MPGGLDIQLPSDLLIQFQDGASSGADLEESLLGGIESIHGEAKGRELPTSPVITAMQDIGPESGRDTAQELGYMGS